MPKPYRPKICTCHNCGVELTYRSCDAKNIWLGGPWYCGNCNANVTEDVYGKKPDKNKLHDEEGISK